jgi:hypothetical protein
MSYMYQSACAAMFNRSTTPPYLQRKAPENTAAVSRTSHSGSKTGYPVWCDSACLLCVTSMGRCTRADSELCIRLAGQRLGRHTNSSSACSPDEDVCCIWQPRLHVCCPITHCHNALVAILGLSNTQTPAAKSSNSSSLSDNTAVTLHTITDGLCS